MFRSHPALSHRVLVNLLSGNAIEGVLTKVTGHFLIIKAAKVHEPGTEATPADGEIVIDSANVDYIQKL